MLPPVFPNGCAGILGSLNIPGLVVSEVAVPPTGFI